jgi:hypothetical protein
MNRTAAGRAPGRAEPAVDRTRSTPSADRPLYAAGEGQS